GDDPPDDAVVGAVEIRLRDDVADSVPRGIAEQEPAQDGLLRFHGVRRQPQRFDLGVARDASGSSEAVRACGCRGHDGFFLLELRRCGVPCHREARVCHPTFLPTIRVPVNNLWATGYFFASSPDELARKKTANEKAARRRPFATARMPLIARQPRAR